MFSDFAPFADRLAERLGGGRKLRSLHARGAFDAGSSTLVAHYVAAGLT